MIDNLKMALMNVSHYVSIEEYMKSTFSRISTEEAEDVFKDEMERGFIQDITCGTYNGASDTFDPWTLTDNNILDTILNALHEEDFYSFMADIYADNLDNPNDAPSNNSEWIREYTQVYEVFIIDGNVYVNQD